MTEDSTITQLLEETWTKRREGNYDAARKLLKQAHKLCKARDYNALGRVFHIYAQIKSDHNHPEKALDLCMQSLAYYIKANNLDRIAHSKRHIADIESFLGNDAKSENIYREAINIYRSNDTTAKGDLANALRGFGLILEKSNKTEEAILVWKETKALYLDCNLQAGVDEANERLKRLL